MSFRDLVEADCGGANPLMRLGSHFMRDAAYKDEGLSQGAGPSFINRSQGPFDGDQLVNEFLGQIAAVPPQTFRMDALLQEMREIDAHQFHPQVVQAPPVIEEVNSGTAWASEFVSTDGPLHGATDIYSMNENKNLGSVRDTWELLYLHWFLKEQIHFIPRFGINQIR